MLQLLLVCGSSVSRRLSGGMHLEKYSIYCRPLVSAARSVIHRVPSVRPISVFSCLPKRERRTENRHTSFFFFLLVSGQISSKHEWVGSIHHAHVIKLPPLVKMQYREVVRRVSPSCPSGLPVVKCVPCSKLCIYIQKRHQLNGDFDLWWINFIRLASPICIDTSDISRPLNVCFTS